MLRLYFHPFASFCQKVLIALYEKDVAFEPVYIDLGNPENRARLAAIWPFTKFPVLEDAEQGLTLPETSVIIDYLDLVQPEPRMVPADPRAALRVRVLDRVCDNFLATSVTKIVVDTFRPSDGHDEIGVAEAHALISRTYAYLDAELDGRSWLAGADFSLADCAAAPTLFYANTIVPIAGHDRLASYYDRLRDRPSFSRVIEEARPHRALFPLPWPPDY